MGSRTLALLKPGVLDRAAALQDAVEAARGAGLRVAWHRRMRVSEEDAGAFYGAHEGRFFFERLVLFLADHEVDALVLEGPEAVSRWRALIGPTHRRLNRGTDTLRGRWAFSDTRNAFHGSGNDAEAEQEIDFFMQLDRREKD